MHHHPAVPGRTAPFVVALVELAEGVRMLGQLRDADPSAVTVGAYVELALEKIDSELTLPAWRLASQDGAATSSYGVTINRRAIISESGKPAGEARRMMS